MKDTLKEWRFTSRKG